MLLVLLVFPVFLVFVVLLVFLVLLVLPVLLVFLLLWSHSSLFMSVCYCSFPVSICSTSSVGFFMTRI